MAVALGISAASVFRHWRANGLKPHVVRGFKVSGAPRFVEKLEDIVGRHLSPPEHALVMSCDVKNQVRAVRSPLNSANEEGTRRHHEA